MYLPYLMRYLWDVEITPHNYYKCTQQRRGVRCGYYLHKECLELKDLPQIHHPLHPQHPLAVFDYCGNHCKKSFVCSFCGKKNQSSEFYQCCDDQCDFYLDNSCSSFFWDRPEIVPKFEIQHVLHDLENHRLSPCINFLGESDEEKAEIFDTWDRCDGCTDFILARTAFNKCIACSFSLHTKCSQVPKEVVQHPSHPEHPLVLLQNPPPPASHHHHSDDELRCTACLNWIQGGFYLHCNHCPTFNLDLRCYFQLLKPTFKHEAHEHPLASFWKIDNDDVRCYACNTPCKYNFFRCFTCNFHIHSDCLALPNTVNYDDHVHSLTLTTSFGDDEDPSTYYCDICEKPRDPDHGIYLCEECPFMAHFECALSLSTAEEAAYAYADWSQKLKDEKEKRLRSDEKVCVKILDQLNEEIEKVREVIQQLFINKKEGEQLTEKIQEFDERRTNAERRLKLLNRTVRAKLI